MASLPNPKVVTYEEWLQMPIVSDEIEEVVDGEIRLMPPNKWKHAETVENVRERLATQLPRREFRVIVTNFGLVIRTNPLTSRVPDLAVFELSKLVQRDGYIHSAPQLIMEVRSRRNSRRDLERIRQDYESLGVPEYWLADPDARSIDVYVLENGHLHHAGAQSEGILKPRPFPNVQIDIAEIWPD